MATKRSSRRLPAKIDIIDESPDSVARRTFIVLTVVLGFALLLMFLYAVRDVLLLLVIAAVFALALSPFAGWLIDRGLGRLPASLVAVLVTLVIAIGVIGAAASPLISQTSRLINNFPAVIDDVSNSEVVRDLDERYQIVDKAKDAVQSAPTFFGRHQSSIVETARTTFGAITNSLVVIVLTFFLLFEGPASWKTFTSLLNPRYAKRVDRTGDSIAKAVGGYVTGNLFISLVAGLVAFITLTILGVPYAFPLAVLIGIFDLIPLIGASLAMVVVAIVAFASSTTAGIAFVTVSLIYQQVENHFIQPVVYSRTVHLSPLLVLVATIVGATLGGIVGVLLAIPAAATVQTIVLELLSGTAPGRRAHLSSN